MQKRMTNANGTKRALKVNLLEWQDSFKIGENGAKLTLLEILDRIINLKIN